jgi:hypothetical protein
MPPKLESNAAESRVPYHRHSSSQPARCIPKTSYTWQQTLSQIIGTEYSSLAIEQTLLFQNGSSVRTCSERVRRIWELPEPRTEPSVQFGLRPEPEP